MNRDELTNHLRNELTSGQRTADMRLTIDPGFVHHRKIQTVLGQEGMSIVDREISRLPELPEWMRKLRIDHVYKNTLLAICQTMEAPTLGELLSAGHGRLFCSTEELLPSPDVYDADRAISQVAVAGTVDLTVELHYSTANIVADTTRSQLAQGSQMAVVALQEGIRDGRLLFSPLLIGAPWLYSEDETPPFPGPEWESHTFYENFIEDIAEFAEVLKIEMPSDFSIMEGITENAFKQCLAEILRDSTRKDWGGETSDHFTSHVHLGKRRTTAAFALKGPGSGFKPMGLNHLGKNNDQIYRLAQEPADLLVVQHCHEILPPVRATLRAFAVQPGSPRRYCLIDGRDSLRLLTAYDKLEHALELSRKGSRDG